MREPSIPGRRFRRLVRWRLQRLRRPQGCREHSRRAAFSSCRPLKDAAAHRARGKCDPEQTGSLSRGARRTVSMRRTIPGLKRGSVQRARMESRRSPADLQQVAQDLAYLSGVGDDRGEPHLGPTPGTEQRALAVRFAATLSARKRACRARAAALGGPLHRPSRSAVPRLSDRRRAAPSWAPWRRPAGTSAPGGTASIPGEQRVRGGASAATVPCTVRNTTRNCGCSEGLFMRRTAAPLVRRHR